MDTDLKLNKTSKSIITIFFNCETAKQNRNELIQTRLTEYSATEILSELTIMMGLFEGTAAQKQTLKRCILTGSFNNNNSLVLVFKGNKCLWRKLEENETIKNGRIISATVTPEPEPEPEPELSDDAATVARLEKENNSLNDGLSISKAGHKEAQTRIKELLKEVEDLKIERDKWIKESSRLRKEANGTKEVYSRLVHAIKKNATKKVLREMVG